MNKYRFRLGKSPDTTTNYIINGTFASGANWTAANVTIGGGEAAYLGTQGSLIQTGILVPGTNYRLYVDAKSIFPVSADQIFIKLGDYASSTSIEVKTTAYSTYQKDMLSLSGADLRIDSLAPVIIDNLKLYKLEWNSPLVNDPVDWDKAKITKKRDEQLNGLIINYINNLTFINDGYDFILNELNTNGFCGEIPVLIEELVGGLYKPFFEGIIYTSDCEFNLTNNQVKVSISDNNASQILIKNKNVKVPLLGVSLLGIGSVGNYFSPKVNHFFNFFNAAGAYPGGYQIAHGFLIDLLLKEVVSIATDMKILVDSTYFGNGGTFGNTILVAGAELRHTTYNEQNTKISFAELFLELNKIFNIGFSMNNINGIPTLKIEDKASFLSSTAVLNLSFVNNLIMKNNVDGSIKTIKIGYEFTDATADGNNQTPYGIQFQAIQSCSEKELDLVSQFIQSSDVILNLLSGAITSNKYDDKLAIVQTTGRADNDNAYDDGSHTYNPDLTYDKNMERWVNFIQSNVFKTSDNTLPLEVVKTNNALTRIYSFKYPITKTQFDLIDQAEKTITFDTDGTAATKKSGYVLEATYEIKTGLTEFKLLA